MLKIGIIGAGLAGITAANKLKKYADITIFEKSRGVGGRIATRRANPYNFDHGAQFFTIRTSQFKSFCQPLIDQDIIKCWNGNFVEIENNKITQRRKWDENNPHYVGVPNMNAIGKYLSQGLNIQLETKVHSINKINNKWHLYGVDTQPLGSYDWIIITAPAAQTLDLISHESEFHNKVKPVKMQGCFSLMLGFEKPLSLEFNTALVRNADISWISVNSSKPDRNTSFSLLIHSTNKWADKHIDDDRQEVLNYLRDHTSNIIGRDLSVADHQDIHGWRYANIAKQSGEDFLIDPEKNLGICGDWFIQGRIESAFISSFKMADMILQKIK